VVLGCGCTQEAGGAHAEVMALRDASAQGAELRGATAWVSLEPCAHHGRTPPCVDALIRAGIRRVVAAIRDPFPAVDGRGVERLRAAGVEVELAAGTLAEAAFELNIGFFSRFVRGRPWVRLKVAASLDGRTALPDGRSQWITGAPARKDGHSWRRRAGVLLTGVGTVIADNPQLDVREVPTARQPLRAVLDPALRIPPDARVLSGHGTLVYTRVDAGPQAEVLRERGAVVVALPSRDGRFDLDALLRDLVQRSVNELHVEGGAHLNGSWLLAGQVDELLVYIAPMLLGAGAPLATLPPPNELAQAPRYDIVEVRRLGGDVLLRMRPGGPATPEWGRTKTGPV
jgi:diaminohydroxyphosphoribosylaminopyrimidine deaminase/5-amino-6-(5-phosphoribosylamino)uracil reductase